MSRSSKIVGSVIEAIGETPLVDLCRICPPPKGKILAKLEYLNPGLSKKDRIARQIIEEAELHGRLSPGQTVVELTSGNTGTGLAIVCAVKGYPFVAVMSKGNSSERARMMRALGAEVVLVDQVSGSKSGQVSGDDLALVDQETDRIVQARRAFRADQFSNVANMRAHLLNTGPEILAQSNGNIHAFCYFVGTGGTFAGCAAAFKRYDPSIACFIVEPEGAAVLSGKTAVFADHRIQGGGYSMATLPLLGSDLVDGHLTVPDTEAILIGRRLAVEEGIFAGISSGANVAAALHLIQGPFHGKTVVVVLSDSGLKYLSTELWL